MDVDVDGGVLLYALGVAFAVGAVAYFARDVVFALSITVKAALLALAFLAFLLAAVATDRDLLDRVAVVLAGAAYVGFLSYVVSRYGLDATTVFGLLALSAGLFVGLGYALRSGRPALSGRTALALGLALVLVAALLVGADAATAGVRTEVDLATTATFAAAGEAPPDREAVPTGATVGTLTATNEGPFTRPVSLPRPEACLVGTAAAVEEQVYVDLRPAGYDRPDRLAGGASLTVDLVARVPLRANATPLTVAVERGSDCERSATRPTLLVNVSGTAGPP